MALRLSLHKGRTVAPSRGEPPSEDRVALNAAPFSSTLVLWRRSYALAVALAVLFTREVQLDFNAPMSRPRVYIVGLLRTSGLDRIPWPEPVPLTTTCLDAIGRDVKATDELRVSPCYYKHLEAWGIPDTEEGLVEFNGAGRTFHAYKNPTKLTPQQIRRVVRRDVCAAMVAHDPGIIYKYPGGMRKTTVFECMRLMGFKPERVHLPHITPLQMKGLIGNSVCVDVLKALLPPLVRAVQRT